MSRDLSVIGRALAAPVRSAFLNVLMDGSARPASELAAAAGVSASTGSEHLGVLLDAGIVVCIPQGRQRFYRIADSAVAAALEQLGHLSPLAPLETHAQARAGRELARARLCYDHFAGRLGIALVDSMTARQWIDSEDFSLGVEGEEFFTAVGIDVATLRSNRRPLTLACPDWTERRPHLAGSLGAAIATHFIEQTWVCRRKGGRGLVLTQEGIAVLATQWEIASADF